MKKAEYLAGIDEVGRGPIAGPLVVGAATIKLTTYNRQQTIFRGIKDSKKLSEKDRELWYDKIKALRKEGILEYKVSFVSEKTIDKKGISYSLKLAVSNCLKRLSVGQKTKILLDGSLHAPDIYIKQKTIIRGDEKEAIIAAASIVAKVLRDRRMKCLAKKFPGYGFEVHKGYGTKKHYRVLKKLGPSEIHRKSFL